MVPDTWLPDTAGNKPDELLGAYISVGPLTVLNRPSLKEVYTLPSEGTGLFYMHPLAVHVTSQK